MHKLILLTILHFILCLILTFMFDVMLISLPRSGFHLPWRSHCAHVKQSICKSAWLLQHEQRVCPLLWWLILPFPVEWEKASHSCDTLPLQEECCLPVQVQLGLEWHCIVEWEWLGSGLETGPLTPKALNCYSASAGFWSLPGLSGAIFDLLPCTEEQDSKLKEKSDLFRPKWFSAYPVHVVTVYLFVC